MGGRGTRGWHRQDRLTHRHSQVVRQPNPRRPHSRPQQAVVQTWSCRCQTARAQNTRKYSAMCPAAKLVQDQPFACNAASRAATRQSRLRHGMPAMRPSPTSTGVTTPRNLTLPYPGILQGTYHMATRPYRRRTTNGPTSLRPCFPTSSPPASAPHASVAFVLFIVLT